MIEPFSQSLYHQLSCNLLDLSKSLITLKECFVFKKYTVKLVLRGHLGDREKGPCKTGDL